MFFSHYPNSRITTSLKMKLLLAITVALTAVAGSLAGLGMYLHFTFYIVISTVVDITDITSWILLTQRYELPIFQTYI